MKHPSERYAEQLQGLGNLPGPLAQVRGQPGQSPADFYEVDNPPADAVRNSRLQESAKNVPDVQPSKVGGVVSTFAVLPASGAHLKLVGSLDTTV